MIIPSVIKKSIAYISILAAAGAMAVYAVALWLAGGSVFTALLFFAIILCLVLLPGLFLQRRLIGYAKGAMRAVFAFCMGGAFLFLNFAVISFALPIAFCYILPLTLAICEIICTAREYRAHNIKIGVNYDIYAQILVIIGAGALLTFCFAAVLAFAKAGKAGNMVYGQDMLWGAGNAAAVLYGFPLQDMRADGGILHYHYLGDVLVGLCALVGNILPYEAEIYYFYPVICVFLVLSLYAVAKEYTYSSGKALIMPFALLFLNGIGGNSLELMRNMNNVATATLFTSALLCMVISMEHSDATRTRGSFIAYALLCVGAVLTKNMYAALVLCAIIAAMAARGIFAHKPDKWALGCAGILGLVLACAYVFVFKGANNNLVFSPRTQVAASVCDIFMQQPLCIALFFVAAFLSLRHVKELSLSLYLINAAAIGGVLAYMLFSHYSGSEIYFVYAAIYFFILSALDALSLVRKSTWAKVCVTVVAVGLMVMQAVTLAPVVRRGVQIAMRSLGMRPQYELTAQSVQAGDEAGAMYLRQNMAADEVFAVNRTSSVMSDGDGVWHYYTAMSGRKAYVEGWRYIMDYGYDYHELRYRLEQVEDKIFLLDNTKEAYAMAKANGIDYLLVSLPLKPLGFSGDRPVYQNDAVQIYKVK